MKYIKEIPFTNEAEVIEQVKAAVEEYAVVHLSGKPDDEDLHAFYTRLTDSMGTVVPSDEDKVTGEKTGNRWIDITYDPAQPNKYRSSNTRQPLHTDNSYIPDTPDNVNYFYCMSNAKVGGATFFLDLETLIETMKIDGQQQLLEDLQRVEVKHAKQTLNKTRPILTRDERGWNINFNYYCQDPADSDEAKDVVKRFFNFIETRIQNAGIVTPVKLQRGEAVFFNDERVLHGRYAFFTPNKGDRTLIKGCVVLHSRVGNPTA